MSEKVREIDFNHFLKSLLKNKLLIVILLLSFTMISVIYSFSNNYKLYESSTTLFARTTNLINTSYGQYTLPITTIEEYASFIKSSKVINQTYNNINIEGIILDDISGRLSSHINKGMNTFKVSARGGTPEEAFEIASTHITIYLNHVELILREMAVDFYINEINTNIFSLEKSIYVLQEGISNSEKALEKIPKFLKDDSDSTIYTDRIINPLYEQSAYEIAVQKSLLNTRKNEISSFQRSLDELLSEKETLTENTDLTNLQPSQLNSFKNLRNVLNIVEQPELGILVAYQKHANFIIFGFLIGLILSVVIVAVKEYWKYL